MSTGTTLTISGNVSGTGSLSKSGAGTLTLTGTNSYTGGTTISAGLLKMRRLHESGAVNVTGGTLQVTASSPTLPSHPAGDNTFVSRPSSLAISNNGAALGLRLYTGTLDLTNNDLILDYSGASPAANIEEMIRAGYNGGNWQGVGLTSSVAAAGNGAYALAIVDNALLTNKFGDGTNGKPKFDGQNVDDTTVLVKFTHRVDLDLDGVVTPNDAITFGTNFRLGNAATWAMGDLDYDRVFTQNDAIVFSTFYNSALASLPEPAAAASVSLLIASCLWLTRRRRSLPCASHVER
jgi:autotransporter-associated beta strand protein